MAGYIGSKAAVTQVDGYTQTEAESRYANVSGDTFTGAVTGTDLTLSGGVYLGGTGAANALDDYEEGTWTPAIEYDTNGTLSVTYSQRNGAYTKVGNMVTIWGVIRLNGFSKGTASGSLKFTGLPFSSTTVGYRTDLKVLTYRAPFNGPGGFGAMIDNGASYIACVYSRNDNTWIAEADPDGNSEYFFSGSYFTTA